MCGRIGGAVKFRASLHRSTGCSTCMGSEMHAIVVVALLPLLLQLKGIYKCRCSVEGHCRCCMHTVPGCTILKIPISENQTTSPHTLFQVHCVCFYPCESLEAYPVC